MEIGLYFLMTCYSSLYWEYYGPLNLVNSVPNSQKYIIENTKEPSELVYASDETKFLVQFKMTHSSPFHSSLYLTVGAKTIPLSLVEHQDDGDCNIGFNEYSYIGQFYESKEQIIELILSGFTLLYDSSVFPTRLLVRINFRHEGDLCTVTGGVNDCIYLEEQIKESTSSISGDISLIEDVVNTQSQKIKEIEGQVQSSCKSFSDLSGCQYDQVTKSIISHDSNVIAQTRTLDSLTRQLIASVEQNNGQSEVTQEAVLQILVMIEDVSNELSNMSESFIQYNYDLAFISLSLDDFMVEINETKVMILSNAELSNELLSLVIQMSTNISVISSQISNLNSDYIDLKTDISGVSSQCTVAQSDCLAVQQEVCKETDKLIELSSEIAVLESDISVIKGQIDVITGQMEQSDALMTSVRDDIDYILSYN